MTVTEVFGNCKERCNLKNPNLTIFRELLEIEITHKK